MAIRLKHISGTLGILALMAIATPAALAQETPETIPTAFDRLMSTYSGDFFSNRTPQRQSARIFGFGFPERELEWDSHATNAATRDLWLLQGTVDPTLRVPDLVSPYNASLLTMPSSQAPMVGTEFIFESF